MGAQDLREQDAVTPADVDDPGEPAQPKRAAICGAWVRNRQVIWASNERRSRGSASMSAQNPRPYRRSYAGSPVVIVPSRSAKASSARPPAQWMSSSGLTPSGASARSCAPSSVGR
ncbi:hypothetical protein [Amycolatopsis sp. CA-128772]|uniref:hypothetical protein n=1 Tax=Amycolatopsis sp. CA-128772 TaxID=2073159 RepID=UPI000CD1B8FB